MDSNHRTPKRTDLQSVAVGHLATCPNVRKSFRFLLWTEQHSGSFWKEQRSGSFFEPNSVPVLGLNGTAFRSPEPLVGIEPTTYWLQISCSTCWAKVANIPPDPATLAFEQIPSLLLAAGVHLPARNRLKSWCLPEFFLPSVDLPSGKAPPCISSLPWYRGRRSNKELPPI